VVGVGGVVGAAGPAPRQGARLEQDGRLHSAGSVTSCRRRLCGAGAVLRADRGTHDVEDYVLT
jgi:hypothetical protein